MSRFTNDLYGQKIKAKDGRIGYLHDLCINERDWSIQSFVWRRRLWLPGTEHPLPQESFSCLIGETDSYYFCRSHRANGVKLWQNGGIKGDSNVCPDPVAHIEAISLLSSRSLKGYQIIAQDGKPGKVSGLLVEVTNRQVSHVVVESGGWNNRFKTMIDCATVSGISQANRSLTIDMRMDEIARLPKISDAGRMTYAMRVGWWRVTA